MTKCAFCDKVIKMKFDPATGQSSYATHYWYGDINNGILFCDAKCSLDAHEAGYKEWYVLKTE